MHSEGPTTADIEQMLAAQGTRAVSPGGRMALDELIDELAAEVPESAAAPDKAAFWRRPLLWQAAAAVAIAAAIAWQMTVPQSPNAVAGGVQPIESREVVQSRADEGRVLKAEMDWPIRQVRYEVLGEQEFRDPVSGLTVTVLSPEEEVHYLPDTAF